MKIIFGYKEVENTGLVEYFEIKLKENEDEIRKINYEKYMLTSLIEDFHHIAIFDEYYGKLKAMRNNEIENVEFQGNNFNYYANVDRVEIEKKLTGEKWSCTFEEYRKIIKGWKEFLGLRRKEQTKVEVSIF